MKIYINNKEFKNMSDLQKEYTKILNSDDEMFHLKIGNHDENDILDYQFKIDKNEQNLFIFLHSYFNKLLIETDDVHRCHLIENVLSCIEQMYLQYYKETQVEENVQISSLYSSLYEEEVDEYYEMISDDERLTMSYKCAQYDIINEHTNKSEDQLIEEYYHLSTQELVNEYEKKYDEDYHEQQLKKIIKQEIPSLLKVIAMKQLNTYTTFKHYYQINNNDISYSLKRKDK